MTPMEKAQVAYCLYSERAAATTALEAAITAYLTALSEDAFAVVQLAIADPGHALHEVKNEAESMTHWQTRAVFKVLKEPTP